MKLSRWISDLACATRGHHMHLDVSDESDHTWRCRNCGATAHYEPVFIAHRDEAVLAKELYEHRGDPDEWDDEPIEVRYAPKGSVASKTLLTAAIKEGTPPRRLYADRGFEQDVYNDARLEIHQDRDLGDETP